MSRVQITRLAEEDLLVIVRQIAADNPSAAIDFIDRFDQACMIHASQPLAAAVYLPRSTYRNFAVGRYVVFYQPQPDGILVARVLHGARDLPHVLG